MESLIELEEQGWQALSSGGAVARGFYSELLADDAIMVFPGGLLIECRESELGSMDAQPWKTFRIEETRIASLPETVGTLVYRVTAQRQDHDPYETLVSSTYVLCGRHWRLAVHQQTPVRSRLMLGLSLTSKRRVLLAQLCLDNS
jgi:hypothetical protein